MFLGSFSYEPSRQYGISTFSKTIIIKSKYLSKGYRGNPDFLCIVLPIELPIVLPIALPIVLPIVLY